MQRKIDSIGKYNEILAERTIKTRLENFCPNKPTEMISLNMEDSKTNEPHKFVHNLSQKLDLRSPNKHFALQKLSVYFMWKNIRQQP